MNWLVAFTIGVGLGLGCFGGLWLTLRQMIQTPQRRIWVTMSQIGRLALCSLVFSELSGDGIGVILSALGGFWIARLHLIRRLGVAADGR